MPRVVVNGEEYKFVFNVDNAKGKARVDMFRGAVGSKDDDKEFIGYGKSRRDSRDSQNAVKARYEALRNALVIF